MPDFAAQCLKALGPCLSTTLAAELARRHGLTPENARQHISRSKAIKRLKSIGFVRGARFVYLKEDYASARFWAALHEAMQSHSRGYGNALAAIRARGGVMPVEHFPIASGSPGSLKGHISHDVVLQALVDEGLVHLSDAAEGAGACIVLGAQPPDHTQLAGQRARLLAESILLRAVSQWMRNLAVGSAGRIETREAQGSHGALPGVGPYRWDVAAPCFLAPLAGWSADGRRQGGFVVCDVLLAGPLSAAAVQPFLTKLASLHAMPKLRQVLAIFVAEAYERDALLLLREKGVIPATTESLFGRELAQAFIGLIRTLTEAGSRGLDSTKLDALFSVLSRVEGAVGTLRGALFEFVAAEIVRQTLGTQEVSVGRKIRRGGQDVAETDVQAVVRNREVWFIECKGHHPLAQVDLDEVKRWLNRRVPEQLRYARENPEWRQYRYHFELWTTGVMPEETKEMIAEYNGRRGDRTYHVGWKERDDVLGAAVRTNDRNLVKVMTEHFCEHPLVEAERGLVTRLALPEPQTAPVADSDFPSVPGPLL